MARRLLAAAVLLLASACLPAGRDGASPDHDADGDGVPDADDCAPLDHAVSPLADEVCDNGVDDDCDGTASGCEVVGVVDLPARADGVMASSAAWSTGRVTEAGDVDGDGARDLLVGAESEEEDGCYLVRGAAALPTVPEEAWASMQEKLHGEYLGFCTAAGDADGDGRGGIWTANFGAYLYEDWAPGARDPADYQAHVDDDLLYSYVYGTRDLDGDGVPDLVYDTFTGEGLRGYSGPLRGEYTAADSTFGVPDIYGAHGIATADVDGDGQDDLVVSGSTPPDPRQTGLWVFPGPLDAPVETADAVASVAIDEDLFIYYAESLCAGGDFDGDGVADVVIDAVGGQALVFAGPWTGAREVGDALARFDRGAPGDSGDLVCDVDFDGDGAHDLLLGSGAAGERGGAYLLLGPLAGTLDAGGAHATLATRSGRAYSGGRLAGFTGETGLPAYALAAVPTYTDPYTTYPEAAYVSVIWRHGL